MSRTTSYLLRLEPREKEGLEAAAAAEDLTLSAWIRQTLFRELARRAAAAEESESAWAGGASSVGSVPLERSSAVVRVPVSEAELAVMEGLARGAGLSVGRWARRVLRGERAKPSAVVADPELVQQLRRMGVNLNQLTRLANGGQMGAADVRFLLEVLAGISGKLEEVEARLVRMEP
jgi:hypothetical protein